MKYHVESGSQRVTYNDEDEFFDAWEAGQIRPDALYWHKGMKAWKPVYQHEVIADALSTVSIKGTFERTWKLTRQHLGHLALLTLAALFAFIVISIPIVWWAVKAGDAGSKAVHSMVGGKSENVVDFDLPDYSLGWRIGHMGSDETSFIYEVIREDEGIENWSEMISVNFASSGTSVDDAAEAFQQTLKMADESAEIKADDKLDDNSRMVTYVTSTEEGMMRFILGSDGLHLFAYMVKPEAKNETAWSAGRGVVLGARLSTMDASRPAGGLTPDAHTKMSLPLLQVEDGGAEGLLLKRHPLLNADVNSILPWPVLLGGYLLIMMLCKILLDCLLYYLARCASMEINMGNWSEVLKGLHAWRGLVKYNIWNALILGATLIIPIGLGLAFMAVLGQAGAGLGMLLGMIPFVYLAMSTYYGPLVVIDRSSKTFGGKVNAWRAFWDTRRRLSTYWLILLVVLIICAVVGGIANGLAVLALVFIGSLIPNAMVVVPFVGIVIGPLIQIVILLAMSVNYRAIFADENPDILLAE